MTQILTIALALACMLACGAVPPNPPPPPVGMGGSSFGGASSAGAPANAGAPGVTCASACANLAALGCPEDPADCVTQCARIVSDGRFTLDLACRVNARTKADAQACGPASCK